MQRKRFVIYLTSVLTLILEMLLFRFPLLHLHNLVKLPIILMHLGITALTVSGLLRLLMSPIGIALMYLISFTLAATMQTTGTSGSNFGSIWTTIFILSSAIFIAAEKLFSKEAHNMKLEKYKRMYGNVLWTGKPRNFFGLPINFTRFIITDKKIVVRKGFLNVKEEKVELYRIVDMSMNLPLSERVFGCGTITLNCKDVTLPILPLKQVKDPYTVYNLIEDKIEEQKKSYGVLGRDIVGAAINVQGQTDESLEDANGNGIPDCLETPDLDNDGLSG